MAETELNSSVMLDYLRDRAPPTSLTTPEARAWLGKLGGSKGRLAVVWIGWFLVVHFTILWFLRPSDTATAVDIGNVVILLLLGHGIVLIGIGLAVVDLIEKTKRQDEALARIAADCVEQSKRRRVHTLAFSEDSSRPIATGEINGRPLKVRLDGTVEVQTLLGPRRFRNVADTLEFVGID